MALIDRHAHQVSVDVAGDLVVDADCHRLRRPFVQGEQPLDRSDGSSASI